MGKGSCNLPISLARIFLPGPYKRTRAPPVVINAVECVQYGLPHQARRQHGGRRGDSAIASTALLVPDHIIVAAQ